MKTVLREATAQMKRAAFALKYLSWKFWALPGLWRVNVALFRKKNLPRVKRFAGGERVSFEEGMEEACAVYAKRAGIPVNDALRRDILRSWFKNRAVPEDYFIYGFHGLTDAQRAAFVTREEKDMRMCMRLGSGERFNLLHDKFRFYEKFRPFFGRDVCLLTKENREDFCRFCGRHPAFIAKVDNGKMGLGTVLRRHGGTEKSIRAEADALLSQGEKWIIEEVIVQDPRLAVLNDTSVNTVRVCSRLGKDGVEIFEAALRTGRNGAVIDNVSSGGITALVDPATGRVFTDAVDKKKNVYARHPDSGIVFKGFQVPDWEKLKEILTKTHALIPYYPYVGWDFALSEKGWVLVEGNWGNFLTQYLSRQGIRKEFEKCFR